MNLSKKAVSRRKLVEVVDSTHDYEEQQPGKQHPVVRQRDVEREYGKGEGSEYRDAAGQGRRMPESLATAGMIDQTDVVSDGL